jgi:hypothetical protein
MVDGEDLVSSNNLGGTCHLHSALSHTVAEISTVIDSPFVRIYQGNGGI